MNTRLIPQMISLFPLALVAIAIPCRADVPKLWDATAGALNSLNSNCFCLDSHGNSYLELAQFAPTMSGSYFVGNGQSSKIVVFKFNANGSLAWNASYTGTGNPMMPLGIGVDDNGNVYAAANHSFVMKVSSAGVVQWSNVSFAGGYDSFQRFAVDKMGNSYLVGARASNGSNQKSLLIQITKDGQVGWTQLRNEVYAGKQSTWDSGQSLAIDAQNNVYSLIANRPDPTGAIKQYSAIDKFSSNGTFQWSTLLPATTGFSNPYDLRVASNGSIYSAYALPDSQQVATAQVDATGSLVWSRRISHQGAFSLSGFEIDSSGNSTVLFFASNATPPGVATNLGKLIAIHYSATGTCAFAKGVVDVDVTTARPTVSADSVGNIFVTSFVPAVQSSETIGFSQTGAILTKIIYPEPNSVAIPTNTRTIGRTLYVAGNRFDGLDGPTFLTRFDVSGLAH